MNDKEKQEEKQKFAKPTSLDFRVHYTQKKRKKRKEPIQL